MASATAARCAHALLVRGGASCRLSYPEWRKATNVLHVEIEVMINNEINLDRYLIFLRH
jgi:hypothetical protein